MNAMTHHLYINDIKTLSNGHVKVNFVGSDDTWIVYTPFNEPKYEHIIRHWIEDSGCSVHEESNSYIVVSSEDAALIILAFTKYTPRF